DWRGLGSYLALCFGVTWTSELLVFILPGIDLVNHPPPWATGAMAVAMLFPALAAFITRRWITREGFATAGLRMGPPRIYLRIWLLMPVAFAAIYLIPAIFGLGRFDFGLSQFADQ